MTIGKGAPWGSPATAPPDAVADDDAELAALANAAAGAATPGQGVPRLGVRRGDVLRTLGLAGADAEPAPAREQPLDHPFDLGLAELDDGRTVPFVAHLVARRRGWAGEFAVACNVGWVGPWYVGPRAHPNDGLLDVVHGSLPWRQRLEARRRVVTGTHLPHPGLRSVRVPSWEHRFDRPVTIRADGVVVGATHHLAVTIRPDDLVVVA